MKISGWTIPHKKQRYSTCGDWKGSLKHIVISVSRMKNLDYCFLIFIHEVIEAWLCLKRGITEEQVTAFDIAYEAQRTEDNESEPGDDRDAPYRKEHQFATKIEHMLAEEIGINWEEYEKALDSL